MTKRISYRFAPPGAHEAEYWDEAQLAVVEHAGSPLLVLGGPGTGKTCILAEAAARVLDEGQKVLVIAANRQRASELRNDIARRSNRVSAPDVMTFHGLSWALVRRFWPQQDLPKLLTAPEQELRLRQLLDERGPGCWPEELREALPTKAFIRQLRAAVARLRQFDLDPETIFSQNGREEWRGLAEFFSAYVESLAATGELDYGELAHVARRFLDDPNAQRVLHAEYDAIYVDDFADCEPVHVSLLAQLYSGTLVCFADPQQSINAFRGTSSAAVRDFVDLFPGSSQIMLGVNYRASSVIAGVAHEVARQVVPAGLSAAASRYWLTSTPTVGGVVRGWTFVNAEAQADAIAAAVRNDHHKLGLDWDEIAVLIPGRGQDSAFVTQALLSARIPVSVAGEEIPLSDQPAVQVILEVLRQSLTGFDVNMLEYLATSPLGGLDNLGWRKLMRRLHRDELSLDQLGDIELTPDGPYSVVGRLRTLISKVGTSARSGAPVDALLEEIWSATDWPRKLRSRALGGGTEARQANRSLDGLCELFAVAGRDDWSPGVEGARAFLDEIVAQEIPSDNVRESRFRLPGVRVSTMYRAAGEQWKSVYVIGLVDGEWPKERRTPSIFEIDRLSREGWGPTTTQAESVAAELRVLYSAMTRARQSLTLCGLNNGEDLAESRFLTSLSLDLVTPNLETFSKSGNDLTLELRAVLDDESAPPGLREAAGRQVAKLSGISDHEGRQIFQSADPASWWGVRPVTQGAEPEFTREIRLSGSRLEALISCPRKYYLQRHVESDSIRSTALVVGSLVHAVCERGSLTDGIEWAAELTKVWPWSIFETSYDASRELVRAISGVERFFVWQEARTNESYSPGTLKIDAAVVEKPFEFSMDIMGHQVVLAGRIDRLEMIGGRPYVVDIKTSKNKVSPATNMITHPQLGLYQLAVREGALNYALGLAPEDRPLPGGAALLFVCIPDKAGSNRLVRQGQLPGGSVLPAEQQQDSIVELAEPGGAWIDELLRQAVETIVAGEYPATPSTDACKFCSVASSCPAVDQGKQVF